MSKRTFSQKEKAAVFKAHNGICHFCRYPCDLDEMQVDHVIPERLLDHPEELQGLIDYYGLPSNFRINSFENWAPIHLKCNNIKADKVYLRSQSTQDMLEKARALAPEAEIIASTITSKVKIARSISYLKQATEDGSLTTDEIKNLSEELQRLATPGHIQIMTSLADKSRLVMKDINVNFVVDGFEINLRIWFERGVRQMSITMHRLGATITIDAMRLALLVKLVASVPQDGPPRFDLFVESSSFTMLPQLHFLDALSQEPVGHGSICRVEEILHVKKIDEDFFE